MNTILLVPAIILLGVGLVYFYSKAIFAAIKIHKIALQTRIPQIVTRKQTWIVIMQLGIYLLLGGICLALIVFYILGGDALSLVGCIAPLSFITGIFFGISSIWRLHLVNLINEKANKSKSTHTRKNG
ncbi:MAG: hypothetical protein GY797_39180 [Deltaproteobacteria bacterium]|nr:hypothetical protein [Deltaproteobacteria bacterium]